MNEPWLLHLYKLEILAHVSKQEKLLLLNGSSDINNSSNDNKIMMIDTNEDYASDPSLST